jgi:hypothetical protein
LQLVAALLKSMNTWLLFHLILYLLLLAGGLLLLLLLLGLPQQTGGLRTGGLLLL